VEKWIDLKADWFALLPRGGMMGRDSVSREAMSFGRLPE
jgi:hypothetical protein